MRIGVVNWTARRVGGTESYLSRSLPALAARGHTLALLVEMDRPEDREPMAGSVPHWSVEDLGLDTALEFFRAWSPDLVFTHITLDPAVERAAQQVAPAVYFAHAYYGTCISGSKTTSFPRPTPCARTFGPGCLLNFYPRRCGGLNPLTMLRDYRIQSERHGRLDDYRAVLTASDHMRAEFLRHGVEADRVHHLAMPIEPAAPEPLDGGRETLGNRPVTLLFVGRMDRLKGGEVALDALREIRNRLRVPVRLVMVGDGPERERWSVRARRMEVKEEDVEVRFTGWIDGQALIGWYRLADLLLVPSLWPEPFGFVGPEAGSHGLPAVAFPVGGISEWLVEGVSGHFARDGRTPASLAAAVHRALADEGHRLALGRGAREVAARFTLDRHVDRLEECLVAAVAAPR